MTVDYPMYRKVHNITYGSAIEMHIYVRDTTFQQCYCPRLFHLVNGSKFAYDACATIFTFFFFFHFSRKIHLHIAHRSIIRITRNELILSFPFWDDHEHFLKKILILDRIYQYGEDRYRVMSNSIEENRRGWFTRLIIFRRDCELMYD